MTTYQSRYLLFFVVFLSAYLLIGIIACAQIVLSGRVISAEDNEPLVGVTIFVKGNKQLGTVTDNRGTYYLSVPDGATLVFSHVGYVSVEEGVNARTVIDVALQSDVTSLNEIVVVGYGTQLKKDLTGAVSSVQEKDFNKGNFISPDQLIQGRVAGVQITNTSGQPGVASIIKIRGNSVITGTGQPLFVVDGVPLSGLTARPNVGDDFGTSPAANPLNFINPADIASIDILKDASAAAIYGSRAAYGVVNITTKKAVAGEPKIDFSLSTGWASIQQKIEMLDGAQYREAIRYYNASPENDKGNNANGLASILRTGKQQNYNIGISGGNANGKYRVSFGYLDQEGILKKSELKKYNATLASNFKFLESKRLGLDLNLIANQYQEEIPWIRNEGGLVGNALTWNPTDSLWNKDGTFNLQPGGNPAAFSELYNDNSKVTTILASIAPYYELTDWLEFKILGSINYATGARRNSIEQGLLPGSSAQNGSASIYNNENYTNQMTTTLRFHKDICSQMHLTAIAGFEYMKFTNKGSSVQVLGPDSGFGKFGLDYTNYIQYSNSGNRVVASFADPITELQSYFGRTVFDYKKRYLLTATFRADGSTKFGANNKYGYFPSFSAAWIASQENFFHSELVNFLKVRMGWGKTGNQEFPAGAATALYGFSNNGSLSQINNPNPDLKWQADEQFNVGIDFSLLKNRLSVTVDYFNKITTDLLFPNYPIQPAPNVVTWTNLDGKIQNRGLEATVNASIIDGEKFTWNFGFNATFISNNVSDLVSPSPILTGTLHGPGMSGVTVQQIKNGAPLNVFHTRKYLGIDPASGFSKYEDEGNTFYNVGNPNPTSLVGINSTLRYKKLSLTANMYGAFGHVIYNNTLNSTLNVGNIDIGKNLAQSIYQNPVKEDPANPVEPSSRFIEKGDYLKMGNATLSYDAGMLGKVFKQARFYITGQNLFTVTHYSGFDPEVSIDKSFNTVPSLGIDYQAYPRARTFLIGVNFTL